MARKYTALRVYKPAGEFIEFEVDKDSTEGKVISIKLMNFNKATPSWVPQWVPVVEYENGVTATFMDFPYALREA